jgi:hypothetical protein
MKYLKGRLCTGTLSTPEHPRNPSPPGAVAPPDDYPAVHVSGHSRRLTGNIAVN